MKTYVITLSKVFPKGHPKQGEPTGFEEAILNAINGIDRAGHKKIHTIRANYGLWLKRFMDIEAGNAILSIRQWTGAPYRSKHREIAWLSKEDGIGIQRLQLVDLFRATTISLHRRVSHSCQERGQNPQRPTKESNTIYPQF